jgi:hypothetical protein
MVVLYIHSSTLRRRINLEEMIPRGLIYFYIRLLYTQLWFIRRSRLCVSSLVRTCVQS